MRQLVARAATMASYWLALVHRASKRQTCKDYAAGTLTNGGFTINDLVSADSTFGRSL